jgi:hypothetical protein
MLVYLVQCSVMLQGFIQNFLQFTRCKPENPHLINTRKSFPDRANLTDYHTVENLTLK